MQHESDDRMSQLQGPEWRPASVKFADRDLHIGTTLARLNGEWVDVMMEPDDGDGALVRSYPGRRIDFVNWVVASDEAPGKSVGEVVLEGTDAEGWPEFLAGFDWDETRPAALNGAGIEAFAIAMVNVAQGLQPEVRVNNVYDDAGLQVTVLIRPM